MSKLLYTVSKLPGMILPPAYPGDAGMDVVSVHDYVLPPFQVTQIDIGVSVAIEDHLAFTFITRSSWVAKGVFVLPTLIDSGYRGPLYLFAINLSNSDKHVWSGDRVAQLVLLSNNNLGLAGIEEVKVLPPSSRGSNGFGSSGSTVADRMAANDENQ